MKKKMYMSLTIGLIISAAACYSAFRHIPLSDLIRYLRSIRYIWVLPSVALVVLSFVFRVIRWQIILAASQNKIGFRQAFHPLMIHFMLNSILPGRIGEIARPVILHKKENIPFSVGLATVAAERVFDITMLLTLFVFALAFVRIDPDLNMVFGSYHLNKETLIMVRNGMVRLIAALLLLIVMVVWDKTRKLLFRFTLFLPEGLWFVERQKKDRLKQVVCLPVIGFIENTASGLTIVKNPGNMGMCMVFSLLTWVVTALSFFTFAQGCPGLEIGYMELFAVLIITCFFIALPSVPGYWGLWEAGGIFALALFGVSAKDAAGYTLANHAVQLFPVVVVGLISAVITGMNVWSISLNDIPSEQ